MFYKTLTAAALAALMALPAMAKERLRMSRIHEVDFLRFHKALRSKLENKLKNRAIFTEQVILCSL